MKNILSKLISLINLLKGKSKQVIIGCVIIFGLGVLGVKYGYIPEEVLDVNVIVEQISGALEKDSAAVVVDTVAQDVVVDTAVVVDSVVNQ